MLLFLCNKNVKAENILDKGGKKSITSFALSVQLSTFL